MIDIIRQEDEYSMAASSSNMPKVEKQIAVARSELKNIRQQIETVKRIHRKDVDKIQELLDKATDHKSSGGHISLPDSMKKNSMKRTHDNSEFLHTGIPIGYIESCFKTKNGTPRQPTVCSSSKAKLKILQDVFNNPSHALQGLEKFSHVWVIFTFHKNGTGSVKAKVKPPRLDGARVGLYSTRTPHRPNPIGLTLAHLEQIKDDTLYLSGVDMIDGTPVLDIKPYIPIYDDPNYRNSSNSDLCMEGMADESSDDHKPAEVSRVGCLDSTSSCENVLLNPQRENGVIDSEQLQRTSDTNDGSTSSGCHSMSNDDVRIRVPSWICEPPRNTLNVRFTPHAAEQLSKFQGKDDVTEDTEFTLTMLSNQHDLKTAIIDILKADPRSTYRNKHCQDSLYFFTVDNVHVTCWFDENFAEVVRIQPITKAPSTVSSDRIKAFR
ncbi:tRNA (adenine(37)-N6)-methyltransferase-like [Ptychodera flava]|uniref:tRNA (adenine(37)-N6)-methyltransferase-like n=1 Tax=Ptychodera flava TaxID=63121 RepID=UPI00396A9CE9